MARPKSKGAYVPLAAQYFMDDAILEAGPSAELLFVRCISFLASVPSDGFITDRQVKTIVGIGLRSVNGSLKRLQEVGLLEVVEGGYVARSWLKWNRSAQEMDKLLARDRERKRALPEHDDDTTRHDDDTSPREGDARLDDLASRQPHVSGQDVPNSERNPDGFRTDSEHQSSTEQSRTEQSKQSSSDADASDVEKEYSDEVKRLSSLLADLARENGHTVGTVGKTWWAACDRIIRLDGYRPDQVEWMIRWACAHEFWQANIRSMPTLRKQFSQMKLQALRSSKPKASAFDQNLEELRQLQEVSNG